MNYALKEMSQQDIRFLLLKLSGSNLCCQQLSQERFVKIEEFHKLYIYFSNIQSFPGDAGFIPRNLDFSKEKVKISKY